MSLTNKTKKIITYSAAALLLFVTVGMVYAAMVSPSKAPYRAAAAKYKNVYNANVAFTQSGVAMGASTATDEQFTKNLEVTRTHLQTLRTEADALGKQSVLQQGEGKERYVAFNEKLTAYLQYNTDILASIEKLRPVLYKCNQQSEYLSEAESGVQALHTCVSSLKALHTVADADYQAMLESFIVSYAQLEENFAAVAALGDPDGADSARKATYEADREIILNDLNTASATLTKNLATHRAEVDITETAKALDKYLSKKASIFSL